MIAELNYYYYYYYYIYSNGMGFGEQSPPNAKIIIIIIKTFLNSCINALFLEDNIKPFLDTVNGLQQWKTHRIKIFYIVLC